MNSIYKLKTDDYIDLDVIILITAIGQVHDDYNFFQIYCKGYENPINVEMEVKDNIYEARENLIKAWKENKGAKND